MSRAKFGIGEYYHIYNRGVEKRTIFLDDQDRWRFLTLMLVLQSNLALPQIGRLIPDVKHSMFDKKIFRKILDSRNVELVTFCLMPNHFHFILKETTEGGISKFMQKLLNAYTKYFNARHGRSGHLFGGKFQSVHAEDNNYLLYLSAYIHLNPRDLAGWKKKEKNFTGPAFKILLATTDSVIF